jgi:hypothetical protein
MPAWEYKAVVREGDALLNEEQLNKFGAHGYELVTVVLTKEERTEVGRTLQYDVLRYFFKRPRQS